MPRASAEYGGCSLVGRATPSASARWLTSSICAGENVDVPIARDLAGRDELVERGERLVDRRGRIGSVHLVQVDVVDLQPAQAVVAGLHDPAPRQAAALRIVAHRVAHLGGQHDLVAAAAQGLAEDRLGRAVVVHVGRVEQRDAGVDRPVDHAMALVDVGVAPAAEHHRAEGDRA